MRSIRLYPKVGFTLLLPTAGHGHCCLKSQQQCSLAKTLKRQTCYVLGPLVLTNLHKVLTRTFFLPGVEDVRGGLGFEALSNVTDLSCTGNFPKMWSL